MCYRLRLPEAPAVDPEVLVALLAESPFDAFATDDDARSLSAYLPASSDSAALAAAVESVAARFGAVATRERIADQNWNLRWEESYPPAEVGDFLRIRAPFHAPDPRFADEIVLVPEMSFGTGHHETTFLMCALLHERPPSGKTVFDFGTGTGVLALYAARLGAARVVATDHDPRCVASTQANAARNGIALAAIELGDVDRMPDGPFGLILANIQRGVLVAAMPALAQRLAPGAELWLSGIFADDTDPLDAAADTAGLRRVDTRHRGRWLACRYAHQP